MVTRNGSSDPDSLIGGNDDDILRGKGGDDTLIGRAGADLLQGDDGNDSLGAGTGLDTLYGGTGNDRLHFTDFSGGLAFGGSGADILDLTLAAGPSFFLDFRDGTGSQNGAIPGTLNFSGMESLVLTSLGDGDTVFGSVGNDTLIFGGRGAQADGRGGDDLIGYTPGAAASLDGGDGNDTLQVDAGSTVLYFIVSSFDGAVDDGQLSSLTGFETFHAKGGVFNDIAAFSRGDDVFDGFDGDDTAFGGLGRDSLTGGLGQDSLVGGGSADRLTGGRGSDVIRGGGGGDRIVLDVGFDTVWGGGGADSFIFGPEQQGLVTIRDFESGGDRLLFDPATLQFAPDAGILDPARLSIGTASGALAQFVLTYDVATDKSTLLWDFDGDGTAGSGFAVVRFSGQIGLTASDILIL